MNELQLREVADVLNTMNEWRHGVVEVKFPLGQTYPLVDIHDELIGHVSWGGTTDGWVFTPAYGCLD